MRIILKRRECPDLRRRSEWLLVYGRRKVGKTVLIRQCVKHDLYVLVMRTGKALLEGGALELNEAFREAEAVLRRGVVIDEFQRLPPDYFDVISSWPRSGVLVAAGSGHGVVEEIFSRGSPLLGLLLPYKVDIIAYSDVLAQAEDLVLSAIYRDPWVIPYVDSMEDLRNKAPQLLMVAKDLIGEVFTDEKREAAETYWKILLHVAEGRWKSTELAGLLALKGGLASVSSMLSKMAQMGLLRGIPTLGREKYYMVNSPALSLVLYAEAKYGIGDTEVPPPELPVGREIQFSVGELLAELHDAALHYSPREDIDVVLVRGRRRVWAYEVKMGPITRREAVEAATKLKRVAERAGLVSLAETPPDVADASLGPGELVDAARWIAKRRGIFD